MIRSKKLDIFIPILMGVLVLFTLGLMIVCTNLPKAEEESDTTLGIGTDYVNRLFDDSYVHTIDIQISELNYDYMISHATEESYVLCNMVIDGELVEDVALRPKGNSSLSSIAAQGSERFSFKAEFDHYTAGNTYYGLDKLALNNLGQDKSCMKDYFSYHMMNEMGVAAPLSSYCLVQVNGEDFGLYLAVEAVEDSFCYRNYGEHYGDLYRPDAFSIESISPTDFMNINPEKLLAEANANGNGNRVDMLGMIINTSFLNVQDQVLVSAMNYAGDTLSSYDVIFDTSVFDCSTEDKERLMDTLYRLKYGEDPGEAIDLASVIPYFAVHNFLNNYDSYNGVFVHNFYLHERNGKISMVPWDYNLGFGAFSIDSAVESFFGDTPYAMEFKVGESISADMNYVNYPIDTPTYVVALEDRPMFGSWIGIDAYKEQYHEAFRELLSRYFDSGLFEEEYEKLYAQLLPFVQKGLTFYSEEEFAKGAFNVKKYGLLRAESIRGQLEGSIPSTMDGQAGAMDTLVDTGDLNLGKTIDFEGIAFGITSEDIVTILNVIAGDEAQSVEGVTKAIEALGENPGKIPSVFAKAVAADPFLQKAILGTIFPVIVTAVLFVGAMLACVFVARFKRRR